MSDASPSPVPATSPVPGKWQAAALYAALTLLLTYPFSVRPGRVLPADDPDGHLYMWILSWDTHAFVHQPLSIFDANIFYPNRNTLAYSENLLGSALFAAPILWITGNPVLAVNSISLLACVLCGLGAYVLGRRLGLSGRAAIVCGLVFAFSPPRFFRFPQLHLAVVQWIPFSLASLHAYLDGGLRRDLRYAAGFFTLEVLSTGHGAAFVVLAIAVVLAYRLALGDRVAVGRRLRDLGVVGAIFLAIAAALYVPYARAQADVGLVRTLDAWNTTPESFIASPTHIHAWLLSHVLHVDIRHATAFLFPGYVPLVLGLVGVVAFRRRSRPHATVLASPRVPTSINLLSGTRAWAILVALAAGSFWLAAVAAGAGLSAGNGLKAEYFANTAFAGNPVFTAVARPSTAGRLAPEWNGHPSSFSVRWTGFLTTGWSGSHSFTTRSRSGSRLFVDNRLVIDDTGASAPTAHTGVVSLDAGSHQIRIESVQRGAPDGIAWSLALPDRSRQNISWWMLSQRRTRYWQAVSALALSGIAWFAGWIVLGAVAWVVVSSYLMRRAWWTVDGPPAVAHDPMPVYLLMGLLCVGLALGPPYGLWPYVYRWPVLSFIRSTSRFMVLGVLALAVLAGIGFDALSANLRGRSRTMLVWLTGALMLAEFSAVPLVAVPFHLNIPAADQWLARQPKPFVVAEMPIGYTERYQTIYMLHAMAHWQRTIHGYSGVRPAFHQQLNRELRAFPDASSIQRLHDIGVTYVVVHFDLYNPDERPGIRRALQDVGSQLQLVYSDATARVYRVK